MLKLQDNLDQYERYSEAPKHTAFFTSMVSPYIIMYLTGAWSITNRVWPLNTHWKFRSSFIIVWMFYKELSEEKFPIIWHTRKRMNLFSPSYDLCVMGISLILYSKWLWDIKDTLLVEHKVLSIYTQNRATTYKSTFLIEIARVAIASESYSSVVVCWVFWHNKNNCAFRFETWWMTQGKTLTFLRWTTCRKYSKTSSPSPHNNHLPNII